MDIVKADSALQERCSIFPSSANEQNSPPPAADPTKEVPIAKRMRFEDHSSTDYEMQLEDLAEAPGLYPDYGGNLEGIDSIAINPTVFYLEPQPLFKLTKDDSDRLDIYWKRFTKYYEDAMKALDDKDLGVRDKCFKASRSLQMADFYGHRIILLLEEGERDEDYVPETETETDNYLAEYFAEEDAVSARLYEEDMKRLGLNQESVAGKSELPV